MSLFINYKLKTEKIFAIINITLENDLVIIKKLHSFLTYNKLF